MIKIFLVIALCLLPVRIVYGYDMGMIEAQLNLLELEEVEIILGNANTINNMSFVDLVQKAITGQLDLSFNGILMGGLRLIFTEIHLNISLMKELVFISILAAVLKNLTENFENKAVAELGFYVCYMLLVVVIFSSFTIAVAITEDMIFMVSQVVQVSIPIIMGLVIMSGNVTGAYVFNSLFIFAINIINVVIRDLLIPLVVFIATIQIINYLTENEILGNLSDFMKKIITWGVKSLAIIFISILTIQRISAPILNNLAIRTARFTLNVVPIVGDVLTGAIDSVLYMAQATKSGVIVAVLLSVIYICIVPTIKLVALIFIYKFTSAIIQPISDSRIVKCIDTIGNYTSVLLGIVVMVVVMFTFAMLLMLSF